MRLFFFWCESVCFLPTCLCVYVGLRGDVWEARTLVESGAVHVEDFMP